MSERHLPSVKFLYLALWQTVQHPQRMYENSLPNTEFEFMEKVDDKHQEKIEADMAQPI